MPLFCLPSGSAKAKKSSSSKTSSEHHNNLTSSNGGHVHQQQHNNNTTNNNENNDATSFLLSRHPLRYVTNEFHAKVKDELTVVQDEWVFFEYEDVTSDWSHVKSIRTGKSGYVPSKILSEKHQIPSARKKKMPRNTNDGGRHESGRHQHNNGETINNHHTSSNHHHRHHQSPHINNHHSHSHQHQATHHPHHPHHQHHQHNDIGQAASSNGDQSRFSDHQLSCGHQNVPHSFQSSATSNHTSSHKFHDTHHRPYLGGMVESPATYYNLPTHCGSSYDHLDRKLLIRENLGEYVVMNNFVAREENDLEVAVGDYVRVMNRDDEDWYWVMRLCDKQEGFVPAKFIKELSVVQSILNKDSTVSMKSSNFNAAPTYSNQMETLVDDPQLHMLLSPGASVCK